MTFSVSSSLRLHRLASGLTQSQLGELTGLSQNSISSIERGEYGITLAHALMIARVLRCHVEDIWVLDDERLCDICPDYECVHCSNESLVVPLPTLSDLYQSFSDIHIPNPFDFADNG